MKAVRILAASLLALGGTAAAQAQQTVFMPIVIEVSGNGAVSGTNFRDGALMAIDEINAKGGILKRKINAPVTDTQSNAAISRAQVQKAIDGDPYVIFGPVFSGSVKVNMQLAQQAEVPQIVGAEAAEITQMGNPYVFRTSFGQQMSMPKMAAFVADGMKARTVAFLWVNNDYGKGGRDVFFQEMKKRGIKVVADVSTESGQVDFAADIVKMKASNADVMFIYTNEEECARVLREARKQGVKQPIIGETNVISQKVIDLAGETAEGAKGHVGLTADAPIPAVQAFTAKFQKRYKYVPDHNGLKGYMGVYAVKYATEKLGKFDRKALAKSLHGMTITPQQEPGILIETTWDDKGDVDRISFLVEVVKGRQKVVEILPKLGK
ncbi:MAG TPA: ABC transporter substrate-binding protein [Burkholderiales bacterium]|nr:ABC transporter substrate-binding protein [Burkholderiales bacterium]